MCRFSNWVGHRSSRTENTDNEVKKPVLALSISVSFSLSQKPARYSFYSTGNSS